MTENIFPANKGIESLVPYTIGKPIDELRRELGLDRIVKLASNENPLGASPKVKEAVTRALDDIGLYPDGSGYQLKQALSHQFGVVPECITLGNGSNDILELVARTFVSEHDSVVYSQHAFAIYALVTKAVGASAIEVPAHQFGHDLDAMAKAILPNTKVVFIANPNNPTGTWFTPQQFDAFMVQVPSQTLVVLDEAYVEYFPEDFDSVPFLAKYPNVLISRTFSKAYGLASLRVGFAFASEHITGYLNRVRQPFNVNSFALAAAEAALTDLDFLTRTRELNQAGLTQLCQGFDALGLSYIPSKANFVCVRVGQSGRDVYQSLLQKGVIVRPVDNYQLPEYIRVTTGTAEENLVFLEALAQVIARVS